GDDLVLPAKSSLPKAQVAEEAKVPENMLPQLAKRFAINEAAKDDEVDAEEGAKSKKEEKNEKAVDKKSENETLMRSDKTADNKIDQEDALRRLAIEKLKEEQKFSKKMQAEQNDAI